MSAQAFTLVILAGLIHAAWNVAAKHAGGGVRFAAFTGLVGLVFWAPVGLWLAWQQLPSWGWPQWLAVAASSAIHTLYYLTLLRGYRKADLTVVYPVGRGSGPLISSFAALMLFDEVLTALSGFGIAAVVGGVFMIAGGPRMLVGRHTPEEWQRIRQGLRYGLLTGLFIAAYTVMDAYSVKRLGLSPILLDYMGNLLRVMVLAPWALRDWQAAKQSWRLQRRQALFVGIVSPVAYVLVLYAITLAPLSHVAPAREISMLFAALIGGHLLRESDRAVRLIGACLIAMGVVALGLG